MGFSRFLYKYSHVGKFRFSMIYMVFYKLRLLHAMRLKNQMTHARTYQTSNVLVLILLLPFGVHA